MASSIPRKPEGYHKLSLLQGCFPEYAILRRFGRLSMMSLLDRQAELVVLEKEFWQQCNDDDLAQANDKEKYSNYFVKLRENSTSPPQQLVKLQNIREKLKKYYDELLQAAAVAALPQPEAHQVRLLRDWLKGEREGDNFLQLKELKTWSIEHDPDFVTFLPSTSWMNPDLIEFFHWLRHPGSWKRKKLVSSDSELGRVYDSESTRMGRAMKIFWTSAITLFASLLPVLAILVLYFVEHTLYRIAITIAFTAFFGVVLIIFTSAELKEVFGATAAFAAVEVVFIGSANGI